MGFGNALDNNIIPMAHHAPDEVPNEPMHANISTCSDLHISNNTCSINIRPIICNNDLLKYMPNNLYV